MGSRPRERRVVLVGGGHANVQVLERWRSAPVPGVELTLISDRPEAVYSGMVPGLVAGEYRPPELRIPLAPLAERAGGRLVVAAARRIDADARRIHLDGAEPVEYDVAALDVGSRSAGLDLPGVREQAIPTRPIGELVRRIAALFEAGSAPRRIAVVGAGAGGVELAFALRNRRGAVPPEVTLVDAGAELLPGHARSLARRAAGRLRRQGIRLRLEHRVAGAEPGALRVEGREPIACDALVWAAGAAAPALFRDSALPVDRGGYLRVRATLQALGRPELLAAGDAAALEDHPETPKAGVYAVRAGPVLDHNLRALLSGSSLRRFRPQRDFLVLLNLGDGSALGAKWGLSFEGRWVRRLKDRIDRRFVERFQVR